MMAIPSITCQVLPLCRLQVGGREICRIPANILDQVYIHNGVDVWGVSGIFINRGRVYTVSRGGGGGRGHHVYNIYTVSRGEGGGHHVYIYIQSVGGGGIMYIYIYIYSQ